MTENHEISIADILSALSRRRKLVLGIVAGFVLPGLLYAVLATPRYTATTIVVVAENEDAGLSSLVASLGPAAALAGGLGLGAGTTTRQTYLAILKSQELANKFIEQHELLPHLFPDQWDAKRKTWKEASDGLLTKIRGALTGKKHDGSAGGAPSAWRAYQRFDKIRLVNEDVGSGTVSVSFTFRDPELAAQWANDYVALANHEIRTRTIEESSQALDYLNERAESTSIVGLRETIFRLIESHLEKITLASARPEFAFRVIDRAVAPEERSHPKRKLIVAMALLAGFAFATLATMVLEFYLPPRPGGSVRRSSA
ncbi:MAG TPA: Wzz/FepE/Etk N-terminal domain-containing protein [Gammaproteobacteria bacterium]